MATWTIDTPLRRFGYGDDEKAKGYDAPDWECTLVTRDLPGTSMARHLILQFPGPGSIALQRKTLWPGSYRA